MDDDDLATTSAGIVTTEAATAAASAVRDTPPLDGSMADYSPDDKDLDEAAATVAAEVTRDGLVALSLRTCVDRLDASVQCTKLSQLDLRLQLDSMATELKRLSLAQHDCLFCISSSQSLSNKTTSAATAKSATDTCALLDGYARRLCDARSKITVVGNILESTQDRLRVLSHRIGREHNNRRSLLEPRPVVTNVSEEFEFELDDKEKDDDAEETNANNKNKNCQDSDMDVEERHLSTDDAKEFEISPAISQSLTS